MEDHFPPDAPDVDWLPEIGRRGWKVLSKDSQMRHNNIELVALLKANTHSFILTSASQSGSDMAAAFVKALPQMKRIINKFPAPLVSTVSRSGNVSVYLTHDQLIAQIGENQTAEEKLADFDEATRRKERRRKG